MRWKGPGDPHGLKSQDYPLRREVYDKRMARWFGYRSFRRPDHQSLQVLHWTKYLFTIVKAGLRQLVWKTRARISANAVKSSLVMESTWSCWNQCLVFYSWRRWGYSLLYEYYRSCLLSGSDWYLNLTRRFIVLHRNYHKCKRKTSSFTLNEDSSTDVRSVDTKGPFRPNNELFN